MKHEERLAQYAGMIEDGLNRLLPLEGLRQDTVMEAMRYSALGGGKRLRGAFVLEFCRMSGGDVTAALPYACAVEMIHAYSLIHDDLPCMDNDDLRRGNCPVIRRLARRRRLAGDGLLNRAFEAALSADAAARLDAARTVRLARELADAAGVYGMIGGQCIDLAYDGRMPDRATLDGLIALKTGALIRVSCRMGCIAGGAEEKKLPRQIRLPRAWASLSRFATICWTWRATRRCSAKRRTRTNGRARRPTGSARYGRLPPRGGAPDGGGDRGA